MGNPNLPTGARSSARNPRRAPGRNSAHRPAARNQDLTNPAHPLGREVGCFDEVAAVPKVGDVPAREVVGVVEVCLLEYLDTVSVRGVGAWPGSNVMRRSPIDPHGRSSPTVAGRDDDGGPHRFCQIEQS